MYGWIFPLFTGWASIAAIVWLLEARKAQERDDDRDDFVSGISELKKRGIQEALLFPSLPYDFCAFKCAGNLKPDKKK